MKRGVAALVAACACLLGAHAYAHHSFPGTYSRRPHHHNPGRARSGPLSQSTLIRTGHGEGARRTVVRYAVEWVGASELGRQGVTAMTLKSGDFVVISGMPGRNPADHLVRMTSLRRPKDGFDWKLPPDRMMKAI